MYWSNLISFQFTKFRQCKTFCVMQLHPFCGHSDTASVSASKSSCLYTLNVHPEVIKKYCLQYSSVLSQRNNLDFFAWLLKGRFGFQDDVLTAQGNCGLSLQTHFPLSVLACHRHFLPTPQPFERVGAVFAEKETKRYESATCCQRTPRGFLPPLCSGSELCTTDADPQRRCSVQTNLRGSHVKSPRLKNYSKTIDLQRPSSAWAECFLPLQLQHPITCPSPLS